MTNQNTNPDYYKGAEKTALVRLCGVLGVLTENNDLSTAALLAATRIERLEKKIPALNVDLAEASMHAYNGEVARMKLEAENARLTAELAELKETKIADIEKGLFFGKPVEYWLRLQNQAQESTRDKDIEEILLLKSLVFAREQDLNELHIELSQLRERTRWIPVSERLPKRDGFYLVLENVNQVAGYYHWCKQFGWNTDGGRINIQSVTHWMPLPPPPEAE